MEYYSAIKKNSFESVLMRWMKLEPIIQSCVIFIINIISYYFIINIIMINLLIIKPATLRRMEVIQPMVSLPRVLQSHEK